MDFIDLQTQQTRIKAEIDAGIARVLAHGRYVFGPEIDELEGKLASFAGAEYAIACANGTDAILLNLMAWGIGPGDAVFCPSFTFCATAEVIALAGATPVFVDVERDTYNIDARSLAEAIDAIVRYGKYRPKAVIAVDLFGQSANYPSIAEICRAYQLKLIADSAQGFGTTLEGHQPLHWADVVTTSFFPAKPLGCYGDGGAMFTNDSDQNQMLRSLHMHGAGQDRYDNVRVGMNSRLDTIQAAVLLPKLEIFADEIRARNRVAETYTAGLEGNRIKTPYIPDGIISTWAQYTIEVSQPNDLSAELREQGIPTARYYPRPVHVQTAYADCPVAPNGLPNTDEAASRVISLPMHPYLEQSDQDRVIEAIQNHAL